MWPKSTQKKISLSEKTLAHPVKGMQTETPGWSNGEPKAASEKMGATELMVSAGTLSMLRGSNCEY